MSENTMPAIKNNMYDFMLNKGVRAKKNNTSPKPIIESIGLTMLLFFKEKYSTNPNIFTKTNPIFFKHIM
ncbi:hypothetical protein MUY34_16445 [Flavihalobacter algicola]|uniref:Uncharacterized protein n=1 Tax=Psychroserpens algicola TaxID=1719034 RepID=A0ABT0HCX9_9FLAO|nr:hypothetical protein [Psychroserpens algicola]MCK8482222.1 hypothetical protein [Psychroserpens algicola]